MCLNLFTQDIGIDLGTANTLVYIKNKGIVLNEPSVIAEDVRTRKIFAVGREAKEMIGRAPADLRVVRPLEDGVISDLEMAQAMLREFLHRVLPDHALFKRVRIVVGVPSGVTGVEKRAVEEVARQMGARDVFILDESMAAAIGVGIPVEEPSGHMIADIGGGTSDISIISLGGVVTTTSLRDAGDEMDEAIVNYMRRNFNLLIGDATAEQIKIKIGAAMIRPDHPEDDLTMDAKGRDVLTGLPKTVAVRTHDVTEALAESLETLLDGVKHTLEQAPPELAADIATSGIVLAGGGALLRNLDVLISLETGLDVRVAENALEAVAYGTGKSLENIGLLRRTAMKDGRKYY